MEKDDTNKSGYIFDPENAAEMARLISQDHLATEAAGGIFAGLSPATIESFHAILDVACGPGSWVLDVAYAHPIIEVSGIDISQTMIQYALARARSQRIPNASFKIMDIKKRFKFPNASFDLINARFLFGVLQRNEWKPFIHECTRLLKPGGILRLAEPVNMGNTNSPAHRQFTALLTKAMWRAGYGLGDESSIDSTFLFPSLLHQAGYEDIHYQPSILDASTGTDQWSGSYENYLVVGNVSKPLIAKTGVASLEEYEQVHQQMLIDMKQEDFCLIWHSAIVWGTKR
jgi:trans-aconitate methyltransferase